MNADQISVAVKNALEGRTPTFFAFIAAVEDGQFVQTHASGETATAQTMHCVADKMKSWSQALHQLARVSLPDPGPSSPPTQNDTDVLILRAIAKAVKHLLEQRSNVSSPIYPHLD